MLVRMQGEYTVSASGSETMLNSLMYKTSYYDFGKVRIGACAVCAVGVWSVCVH